MTQTNNQQSPHRRARAGARPRPLYVLIACEESQAECEAFRALGHIAYSCDIQPCKPKGHPEWHIHGDVTPLLDGETQFKTQDGNLHSVPGWNLIIAHPPCTYLCKVSSVQMVHQGIINPDRFAKMMNARDFFLRCLNTQAAYYVAVENPLPMARAQLPTPSCFIQPYWFGEKYSKKTLYWLRNLPPIFPTVTNPRHKCFVTASSGKYRSRTFPSVAKAIAKQWSEYILDELKAPR